jgi:hypothetical protein
MKNTPHTSGRSLSMPKELAKEALAERDEKPGITGAEKKK